MGLDMYAFTLPVPPPEVVDFDFSMDMPDELHYWRKHPNLHGWMEQLYRRKGGDDPDFNLAPVVLTFEDLAALEDAVMENRLPETSGFFFGESVASDRDGDLVFILKARRAIAEGKTVCYVGWW